MKFIDILTLALWIALAVLSVLAIILLAGCGTEPLSPLPKPLTSVQAVRDPCDSCAAGAHCTPCCHACSVILCHDFCRDYPEYCADCKADEYWTCVDYICRQRE